MATPLPEVYLSRDLLADAHRLAELFGGAIALLSGDCQHSAVSAARATLLEARAVVVGIADTVDALTARQHEAERLAYEARAAEHVAPPANGGR